MRVEAELSLGVPGVVLVDISKELPRAKNKRGKPIHRRRKLSAIERIYCHHSGSEGAPGLQGALNSARYVVARRGFHSAAYHYWIPAQPLIWLGASLRFLEDADSQFWFDQRLSSPLDSLAVFRLNLDSERTWHTGGKANTHGISVCLQGNLNDRDLTDFQKECLEALLPWLRANYYSQMSTRYWLSWHSDSGQYGGKPKAACPGRYAEAWLKGYRQHA